MKCQSQVSSPSPFPTLVVSPNPNSLNSNRRRTKINVFSPTDRGKDGEKDLNDCICHVFFSSSSSSQQPGQATTLTSLVNRICLSKSNPPPFKQSAKAAFYKVKPPTIKNDDVDASQLTVTKVVAVMVGIIVASVQQQKSKKRKLTNNLNSNSISTAISIIQILLTNISNKSATLVHFGDSTDSMLERFVEWSDPDLQSKTINSKSTALKSGEKEVKLFPALSTLLSLEYDSARIGEMVCSLLGAMDSFLSEVGENTTILRGGVKSLRRKFNITATTTTTAPPPTDPLPHSQSKSSKTKMKIPSDEELEEIREKVDDLIGEIEGGLEMLISPDYDFKKNAENSDSDDDVDWEDGDGTITTTAQRLEEARKLAERSFLGLNDDNRIELGFGNGAKRGATEEEVKCENLLLGVLRENVKVLGKYLVQVRGIFREMPKNHSSWGVFKKVLKEGGGVVGKYDAVVVL